MSSIDEILRRSPVIPVLVIDSIEDAFPIAEALVAGGLPVLEVTLRTPEAFEAIRVMKQVPGAVVGAGTVLNPSLMDQAAEAGAEFAVSPGLTEVLAQEAHAGGMPLLPGVSSATEVMRALDLGFDRLKFFPAAAAGGLPALRALGAVFRGVRFCPTGGINLDAAPDWLSEPSVMCVGGSWLLPRGEPFDPSDLEERARQAAALRSS